MGPCFRRDDVRKWRARIRAMSVEVRTGRFEMRAKPAPSCDELGTCLLATVFITPQGLGRVSFAGRERVDKHLGVLFG